MPSMNRVFLMGNLTRDPELKQIPSGRSVADMRLAVNERYKDKEGETRESACFVDVAAWGKQAELCDRYLSKGSPILVDGKLLMDSWETDDGQRRSRLKVQAYRVQFVGGRKSSDGQSADTEREAVAVAGHDEDDSLPF